MSSRRKAQDPILRKDHNHRDIYSHSAVETIGAHGREVVTGQVVFADQVMSDQDFTEDNGTWVLSFALLQCVYLIVHSFINVNITGLIATMEDITEYEEGSVREMRSPIQLQMHHPMLSTNMSRLQVRMIGSSVPRLSRDSFLSSCLFLHFQPCFLICTLFISINPV
jgi:hypothetical protein